jgi:uncharacterized protein
MFNGYLEDYANLIDGLQQLYQTAFDASYFTAAVELAEVVLKHFAAPDAGFYDTSDDHESLIARPRNLQDNATPAGNTLMARVLLQLAAYTGEAKYEEAARDILRQLTGAAQQYPTAFGEALNAMDMLIRGMKEVAIIGDPVKAETQALLDVINSRYMPNAILALSPDDVGETATPQLLAYRMQVKGAPSAYVCQHFVCQRPVNTPEALIEALQ